MLTTTERLFRLAEAKQAEASRTNGGPQSLVSSPTPGRSTLIKSAPRSARYIDAVRPVGFQESAWACDLRRSVFSGNGA
jgi:hypothetical protein